MAHNARSTIEHKFGRLRISSLKRVVVLQTQMASLHYEKFKLCSSLKGENLKLCSVLVQAKEETLEIHQTVSGDSGTASTF